MTVVPAALDAIILADDPLASVRIAGLTARERASRSAKKAGATRVLVLDGKRDEVTTWRNGSTAPLLVIRADQLVHTPLVSPLVDAMPSGDDVVIAVGPDGAYAGAYLAAGAAAQHAIAAIAKGENAAAFVGAADATRVPHGAIARHAIATPEDRRGAHELLYRLMVKPQDNAISRYVFRPVARRLSKLLVHTPITPNMLTMVVAGMIAVACVLTATADMRLVIIGALIQASTGYIDCCDGEIARLKLMSSKFGAWLDTIVDEASTIAYMAAIGWHCHLVWGHPGLDVWTGLILVGLVTYPWSVYCIYYNIIVGVGSANSQDYAGKFEIVPVGDDAVRIVPVPLKAVVRAKPLPPVIKQIVEFSPNFVRRDFIVWATLGLALLHLTKVSFFIHVGGGAVGALICTKDHIHLRGLRRSVARSGKRLLPPTA